MADQDKPKRPGASTTGGRKKASRAPILDLKATEVEGEKGASGADEADSKTPSEKSSETSTASTTAAGAKSAAGAADTSAKEEQKGPAKAAAGASAAKPDEKKFDKPATPASGTKSTTGDPKSSARGSSAASSAATAAGATASGKGGSGTGKPTSGDGRTDGSTEDRANYIAFAGAGAAGAFLCFVVLAALQFAGLSPWGGDAPDTDALQARVAALESSVADLSNAPGATDEALTARVTALEGAVGSVEEIRQALSEGLQDQGETIAALGQRVEAASAEASRAAQGLKDIEGAVKAAAESGADGTGTVNGEALALQVSTLSSRVDRLAESLRAGPGGDLQGRVDEIARQVSDLSNAVGTVRTALDSLDSAVKSLPVSANSARLSELADSVTKRLDAIDARLGGPGETRGAAAAIALAGLRRAVDTGGPFVAELGALKSLVPDEAAVAILEPHAQSGIATRSVLAAEFPQVVKAARTGGDAPAGGGFMDNVMTRLETVVKVRRTGDDGATDEASVLARMAGLVKAGALEEALAEASRMDGEPSQAVASWLARAEARLSADRALDEADRRMMAALARTGD